MATATGMEPTTEVAREARSAPRRSAGTGKRRAGRVEDNSGARFFLGKTDGAAPVLEREVNSENEALLESLKTGQSYFAVLEWRAIADLSTQVPHIRKEAVKRDGAGTGFIDRR